MRRHFIYVGDVTTVGGVVVEGLATFTFMGRSVAFHGAKIECPACKSIGIARTGHKLAVLLIVGLLAL